MAAVTLPRLTPRTTRKLWIVRAFDGKTQVAEFANLNSETEFRKIVADLHVGGWRVDVEAPTSNVLPQVPILTFDEVSATLAKYLATKAKAKAAAE